jgi:hypothetical protein
VTSYPASTNAGGSTSVIIELVSFGPSGAAYEVGKSVSLTATAGTPRISPTSATTNAQGEATFSVTDANAETDTIRGNDLTDNTTVPAGTVTFFAAIGSASASTLTAYQTSLPAGQSSNVSAIIKSSNGTPLGGKGVSLAATLGTPTISAGAASNSSGDVSFQVTDTKAETVTLRATDTSDGIVVTQTASITFTTASASASASSLSASPSSPSTGATSDVVVTLDTAGGSPLSGKAVALSGIGGSPSISPPASVTNASGQALFYVTDSHAETDAVQVRDTTDNVTVTQTASITFVSSGASASASSLAAYPTSLAAGATSDVIVTLDTAGGSPLSGKTVTLTGTAGSPSISPSSSVTNSSGQALFYVTDSRAEADTVQVRDTTDGVTVTQSAGITFTSSGASGVSASASSLSASPTSLSTSATSDVIVTLHTSGGSAVSGKTVALSATAGTPTISPSTSVTNSSGQALFYVSDARAEADTLQVRDTTDNLTVAQTAGITFVGAAVSASASSPVLPPPRSRRAAPLTSL